jgi:hypothetical protein
MSADRRLIAASFVFTILWTMFMIWWNSPGLAGAVILAIAGVLCGLAWYAGMRLWMRHCGHKAG